MTGAAAAIAACAAATWSSSTSASELCCGVLSVETGRGVVTAYDYDSLDIFTFRVRDRARLATIKACQSFAATLDGLAAGAAFPVEFDAVPPNEAAPRIDRGEPINEIDAEIVGVPGTAGRVLGVQPHARFEGVEVLLVELARTDGDLVTATTQYCNNGTAQVDLASDLRARASGAKLLDSANRTEYQVVRVGGAGGAAVVSDHGPGLKLQARQSVRTWMRFNAPAGEKLTLVVPGAAAPFENVAVPKPSTVPTATPAPADRTAPGADRAGPAAGLPAGGGLPAGAGTAAVSADVLAVMPLRNHPRAQEIVSAAASKATSPQISVSLLAGEDYLIGDCLGVHASGGGFKARLENPSIRLEGTGIVMTFRIPRVSIDALTIRVRPNPTNAANPCTFGQRFSIGGSIGDIEFEMSYDPILDLKECKLTRPGEFRYRWSIGGLNLKPLQNDLDAAARQMIEDALNGESFIDHLPEMPPLRPHELLFQYTINEVNERLGTNCQPL
jgi:hypothetical protein